MPRLLPLFRIERFVDPDSDRTLVERFAVHADQAAFAELVRRHGPMVLGVCRRAARDRPVADGAFQARLVVLAREAGWLRRPEALPSGGCGVARRVALAGRRREQPPRRAGGVSPLIHLDQGAHAPRSPAE